MSKLQFDAGILVRRQVRAELDMLNGVSWKEHKGVLVSTFIVQGADEIIDAVASWVKKNEARGRSA